MSHIARLVRLGGIGVAVSLSTASARAESPAQADPPFHNLRYDDDFSTPAKASILSPWERLKYIPLGASAWGPIFLSLGGEIRERHESYNNPNYGFSKAPAKNSYWLERLNLDADLHITSYFRAFAQLGDDRIFGDRRVSSTTDVDRVDLMQRFVEFRAPSPFGDDPSIRYGREELLYGFQRLIAVREGPNIRRAFDGLRVIDRIGEASVDIIAVQPKVDSPGILDDATNQKQHLGGVYVTTPIFGALKGDFYALNYANASVKLKSEAAAGVEKANTFGVRLFGAASGFDWNFEASDQVGTFKNSPTTQNVQAYLVAALAGYTFESTPWKPRVGFSANDASGDNANSKTIGTFNAMYPRLPYFAETPLMVPSNVKDVRPVFSVDPVQDVRLILGVDLLWRASTTDGLYGSGLTEFAGTSAAKVRGSRVGTEYSADLRWQVNHWLQLGGILAQLQAGPAITQAGGKNMTYAVAFAKFKF